MRTTLTLDSDVAALAERVQKASGRSFKATINDGLRLGLERLLRPPGKRSRYETPSVDLGRCLVGSVDDVAEALATAEGESSC